MSSAFNPTPDGIGHVILPGEAVSGSQDPVFVDKGASTKMSAGSVQTGLPWPAPRHCIMTPHDLCVERSCAAHWRIQTHERRLMIEHTNPSHYKKSNKKQKLI